MQTSIAPSSSFAELSVLPERGYARIFCASFVELSMHHMPRICCLQFQAPDSPSKKGA